MFSQQRFRGAGLRTNKLICQPRSRGVPARCKPEDPGSPDYLITNKLTITTQHCNPLISCIADLVKEHFGVAIGISWEKG